MLLADFLKNSVSALEPLYPAAEARGIVLMLCEALIGTKSYTHIVEPAYQIDKKDEQPLSDFRLHNAVDGDRRVRNSLNDNSHFSDQTL